MPTGAYSMQIGDADARRLELLGQFYDPMSSAFLEAAGVGLGDTVADVGCGHGGVTERIAARVGDTGRVYAVDASSDQLRIARTTLARRPNVTFIHASLEDNPLRGQRVDWVSAVFSSCTSETSTAHSTRWQTCSPKTARFSWRSPTSAASRSPPPPPTAISGVLVVRPRRRPRPVVRHRRPHIDALHRAGFSIERRDRHQPIASTTDAKLVHALGFEQCRDAYLHEVGAPPDQIEVHRRYIDRVLHDPDVTIALFENIQYIARRK